MSKVLHNCPNCNKELVRIKRTETERFLNKVTFQKYYNRKFFCYSCLKTFSYGKTNNSTTFNDETFVHNNNVFAKAGLPATLILLAIIIAMVMSSNAFQHGNLSENLSSYFAR